MYKNESSLAILSFCFLNAIKAVWGRIVQVKKSKWLERQM